MDIVLTILIIMFIFGFVGALLAISDYFSEFRRFNRTLKSFIYYNNLSTTLRNGLGIAEWNKKKCEFSQYIINIILEDFVIIYTHQIRGSLIEVAYKRDLNNIDLDSSYIELPEKSKIIKYVDQSIQYSGMVGLNDITIKIEDNEIKKLRKQLDDFVYLQELANHRSLNEKIMNERLKDWLFAVTVYNNSFEIYGENKYLIDKFKPSRCVICFNNITDFEKEVIKLIVEFGEWKQYNENVREAKKREDELHNINFLTKENILI